MRTKYAQAKVGLVVLISLAILIFTILWGKKVNLTEKYAQRNSHFPNVLGLEEGARVLVNGMPKGRVGKFVLQTDGVIVELLLSKEVQLYNDAYAYIETPGLMDEKVVVVVPGTSPESLPPDALIPGRPQATFTQVFAYLSDMGDNLNSTLDQIEQLAIGLNHLIGDTSVLRNFNSSVKNLNSTAKNLNSLIAESRPKIDSSLKNIQNLTSSAEQIVTRHEADVDTILSNLVLLSGEMHTMAFAINEFSAQIREGEGSLSKLLYKDDLYNDLRRVTANLDSLINEFRTKGVKTKLKIF